MARLAFSRLGKGLLEPRGRKLATGREGLTRSIRTLVKRRRDALLLVSGKMDALSPLSTLRRGYAVPLDPSGRVLRGIRDFPVGDRFELRVADGRVGCETLETKDDEVTRES